MNQDELTDLGKQALKVARRLQALPPDRTYLIVLSKLRDRWLLSVTGDGYKIEMAK